MAVSVLVHAAVIVLTWHSAPPRTIAKEATRLNVRLVVRAPQPPVATVRTSPALAPLVAQRKDARQPARAVRAAAAKTATRRAAIAPAPLKPAVVEAPAASSEPIDGSVFALPHIGIGGTASPRWMKPHEPSAMAPPPTVPPPAMHAHAAREAGRAQIVLELQRQVSAWQAPDAATEGICSLQAQPRSQLDCDNAALQQVVGAQAATLSGLLEAYRSIDPSAIGLSIAYQQGRYQVSLAGASPPQ